MKKNSFKKNNSAFIKKSKKKILLKTKNNSYKKKKLDNHYNLLGGSSITNASSATPTASSGNVNAPVAPLPPISEYQQIINLNNIIDLYNITHKNKIIKDFIFLNESNATNLFNTKLVLVNGDINNCKNKLIEKIEKIKKSEDKDKDNIYLFFDARCAAKLLIYTYILYNEQSTSFIDNESYTKYKNIEKQLILYLVFFLVSHEESNLKDKGAKDYFTYIQFKSSENKNLNTNIGNINCIISNIKQSKPSFFRKTDNYTFSFENVDSNTLNNTLNINYIKNKIDALYTSCWQLINKNEDNQIVLKHKFGLKINDNIKLINDNESPEVANKKLIDVFQDIKKSLVEINDEAPHHDYSEIFKSINGYMIRMQSSI